MTKEKNTTKISKFPAAGSAVEMGREESVLDRDCGGRIEHISDGQKSRVSASVAPSAVPPFSMERSDVGLVGVRSPDSHAVRGVSESAALVAGLPASSARQGVVEVVPPSSYQLRWLQVPIPSWIPLHRLLSVMRKLPSARPLRQRQSSLLGRFVRCRLLIAGGKRYFLIGGL